MIIQVLASLLPAFLLSAMVMGNLDQPSLSCLNLSLVITFALWAGTKWVLPKLKLCPWICVVAAFLGAAHTWRPPPLDLPDLNGVFVSIEGELRSTRIRSFPATSSKPAVTSRRWRIAKAAAGDHQQITGPISAEIRGGESLEIGDRVRVFGWLSRSDERWQMTARLQDVILPPPWQFWRLGSAFRARLRINHRGRHLGFTRRVLDALTLGRNEFLKEERATIAKAGVSHLFSVSGLHLVLVSSIIGFLLVQIRVSTRLRAFLILAVAMCYGILTGLQPPITRALGFLTLYTLAQLSNRVFHGTWCLLVIATIEILREPDLTRSLSFQLSFAAVGGILWLGPQAFPTMRSPLQSFLIRKGKVGASAELKRGIHLTAAAITATAPLTVIHFGTLAPISLLTSLALLPMVTLIMVLGLIDLFVPMPGILLAKLCHFMGQAMIGAQSVPGGFLDLGAPSLWSVLAYLFLIFLCLGLRRKAPGWSLACASAAVGALILGCLLNGQEKQLSYRRHPSQFAFNQGQELSPTDLGKATFGQWHGKGFLHLGRMTFEDAFEFCQARRRSCEILILPRGGKSAATTSLLIQYLRPQVVVCHPGFEESFILAQRAGCLTMDAKTFTQWHPQWRNEGARQD